MALNKIGTRKHMSLHLLGSPHFQVQDLHGGAGLNVCGEQFSRKNCRLGVSLAPEGTQLLGRSLTAGRASAQAGCNSQLRSTLSYRFPGVGCPRS
jgi:hypothetical protein